MQEKMAVTVFSFPKPSNETEYLPGISKAYPGLLSSRKRAGLWLRESPMAIPRTPLGAPLCQSSALATEPHLTVTG